MKSNNKRRDNKGRILLSGEIQRPDGRYMYRYKDIKGNRKSIYSWKLVPTDRVDGRLSSETSIREMKKEIQNDLDSSIDTEGGKQTLNSLFSTYLGTKNRLAESTRNNYMDMWNNHVKDNWLGNMKIVDIIKSHILKFYSSLVMDKNFSDGTIQLFQNIIFPCFELAVDDDLIRKNPCRGCMKDFTGNGKNVKEALTEEQQNRFVEFIRNSNTYNIYLPMIIFMLTTACRCGETIGLTWNDIDMKHKEININHQLIYKKVGDKIQFYAKSPKTENGVRVIPFAQQLEVYFELQRSYQNMLNISDDSEVDGYSGFVFTTRKGKPIQPNCLNRALANMVNAYNKEESAKAIKSKREPQYLPKISAHTLRHTGCTRMAEKGIDVKTLQYIMGHSNISTTMDIYNHVDKQRVVNEMKKLEM